VSVIGIKPLLEGGVHFGHRTRRWNPRMRSYIFTERSGIHIIDLQQTITQIDDAYAVVRDTVANGGSLLFVGTKRQAQDLIEQESLRCNMPFVNQRWLGGTLTNFHTIRKRLDYLHDLEAAQSRGELELLTKKERLLKTREIAKLNIRFGGIKHMTVLPDVVYVVDVGREDIAVHEANKLGLPIVGMVDTNCNPDPIDFVIASNDDAIRAIRLITGIMADAVIEGKDIRQSRWAEQLKEDEDLEEVDTTRRVFSPDDEGPYTAPEENDEDKEKDDHEDAEGGE